MNVEPIKVGLRGEKEERLKKYMRNRILEIKTGLKTLHEDKLIKWRKIYKGVPRDAVREWPFHNASNLVVQLVATFADTLLARVLSAIFKTRPLWVTREYGEHGADVEEQRGALEGFLDIMGIEPSELDLYRVYNGWMGEAIRYGTSTVKSPWEQRFEDLPVPGDGTSKMEFVRSSIYDGPRPEKLAFDDFGVPPAARTIESADFKYHCRRMLRHELEERRFMQIYDAAQVDAILKTPDRTSPRTVQQDLEDDKGAKTTAGYGYAEWDVFECWFRYRIDDTHFVNLIGTYHFGTDTLLRLWYDFYRPLDAFVTARLFYPDDAFYGTGFCEILAPYQEEVSEIHNDRRNAMTVANCKMFRVDPDSKLHSGYKIYPSAMLPAQKDEIEAIALGEPSQVAIDDERMTLDLAERRSGVQSAQQGAGAGTMNKRGVYTAMGTLSLIQEGNSRTDLNVTDMRYAHTKLGRILTREYAMFGPGKRVEAFGKNATLIQKALESIKENRIGLPVYASTASINREVEKQNDLMLTRVLGGHYNSVTQALQAASNPMMPPNVVEYMSEVVKAANLVMKSVMRHFGYDEVDRFVPEPKIPKPQEGGPGAQNPAGQQPQPSGMAQSDELAAILGLGGGAPRG